MRDHWRMVWQRELKRLHTSSSSRFTRRPSWMVQNQQGFALPIAMAMGMVMTVMGLTAIMVAQGDRNTAFQRKETNTSIATSEGGIARTLVQMIDQTNSVLLTRNYDTINPRTGTTFLGPDGIPNSGDEESTAVDEWSGYSPANCPFVVSPGFPNITFNGAMVQGGTEAKVVDTKAVDTGEYTLKAYRYNSGDQTGTLLVQGKRGESTSYISVTLAVTSMISEFPGLLAIEKMKFDELSLTGGNGNVYYDPESSKDDSLTGVSAPGDATRPAYLAAIDAEPDVTIDGTLFACQLIPSLDYTPPANAIFLEEIKEDDLTLSGASTGITHYEIDKIDLDDATLDVDTTKGPVYLYVDELKLDDTGKIRNIRTDGQSPRVGDLRIFALDHDVDVKGYSCIQTAFLYAPEHKAKLDTKGDGCPSDGASNIEGVVWAEEMDLDTDDNSSGIAVPDDLSSLADLLGSVNLPIQSKFSHVKNWQYVKY